MRITIVTVGSRGDIQPYIALGVGFQEAGHQVRLATHSEFAPLARERGLDFYPMSVNPREILETETAQTMLSAGGNTLRFLRQFSRLAEPFIRHLMMETLEASLDADTIMFSGTGVFAGYHIAEKLGVPFSTAFLQPVTPTRAFASPFFPATPSWLTKGRGTYNRFTHVAFSQLMWQCFGWSINRVRQEMGMRRLPHIDRTRQERLHDGPVIYGYSSAVVPRPADWDPFLHVTGYWFLDRLAGWQPPAELVDFLQAGPPPVYVGFGSMKNRNPEEVTNMIVKALKISGQRGILMTGWGGLKHGDLSDDIYPIEAVPHDWLFPQMSAVVHHGGAGTTASGLRAGVPTIIVPFFADQPFWGRRVYEMGVGPKAIFRSEITAERLADAITTAVNDREMQRRAAALGDRIRRENGVRDAVEIIERELASKPRRDLVLAGV